MFFFNNRCCCNQRQCNCHNHCEERGDAHCGECRPQKCCVVRRMCECKPVRPMCCCKCRMQVVNGGCGCGRDSGFDNDN